MKQVLKKIGRFLLWVLPALLAIYVVVKVADYCWYRLQIPIGFHDANWTGKWSSEKYFSTSGRLLVRMPDPLPEDVDFTAEALVYYPIYSPWRTGQFEGDYAMPPVVFTGNSSWLGESEATAISRRAPQELRS